GNSLRCAQAILPVKSMSLLVTFVCGSRAPCSTSTSRPRRNWSRSTFAQSTPSLPPTRLAAAALIRCFLVFMVVSFPCSIGFVTSPIELTQTPGPVEPRLERAEEALWDLFLVQKP